jgi:tRNA pseudouridine32 synthase/23S rRNA pseudouridine746 synthase
LRLHLSSLGFPIVNDRYYPELRAEAADDLAQPLQLLAKAMRFCDPVTGEVMEFCSGRALAW